MKKKIIKSAKRNYNHITINREGDCERLMRPGYDANSDAASIKGPISAGDSAVSIFTGDDGFSSSDRSWCVCVFAVDCQAETKGYLGYAAKKEEPAALRRWLSGRARQSLGFELRV